MTQTIDARFLVRAGLAADLASGNPVPLDRELWLETDTLRIKFGDGATHYVDLAYFGESGDAWAIAAGAADAITATYVPSVTLADGLIIGLRAAASNATTAPTLAVDGGAALVIKKLGGQALSSADIFGLGHELLLRYDALTAPAHWELLNPATVGGGGVSGGDTDQIVIAPLGGAAAAGTKLAAWFAPFDCVVKSLLLGVVDASTSGNVTIDAKSSSGSSILTTLPTVAASAHSNSGVVDASVAQLLAGDFVTFDITSAGTSAQGVYAVVGYSASTPPVSNVTWNPADKNAAITLSDGNMTATNTASSDGSATVRATTSKTTGKWYFEYLVKLGGGSGPDMFASVADASSPLNDFPGNTSHGASIYARNGDVYPGGSAYGSHFGLNDVVGVAYDADANKVWFAINGVWQNGGDPVAGTAPAATGLPSGMFPAVCIYNGGGIQAFTLRAKASAFTETVPTGYLPIDPA